MRFASSTDTSTLWTGTRIFVQPLTVRTRVFQVNYLVAQRLGRSDMRVTSGSVADTAPASGAFRDRGRPRTGVSPGQVPGSTTGVPADSSRILTSVRSDFWEDLRQTLTQIVGNQPGRNVVLNPQASLVVVRAMPAELREVENYLRAIRLSVERQVMLEAKIVEVTLLDQNQAGVNWACFRTISEPARERRHAQPEHHPGDGRRAKHVADYVEAGGRRWLAGDRRAQER